MQAGIDDVAQGFQTWLLTLPRLRRYGLVDALAQWATTPDCIASTGGSYETYLETCLYVIVKWTMNQNAFQHRPPDAPEEISFEYLLGPAGGLTSPEFNWPGFLERLVYDRTKYRRWYED